MSAAAPLDEASFAIRPARSSDATAIAGLLGDLEYPTDAEHVLDRLRRMDARGDLTMVATIGDVPVGTATLHVIPQLHRDLAAGQVTTVVVALSMRGRGIGERLMHALEAEAARRGCDRMEVVSGLRRQRAHRFYERLGYVDAHGRSRRFVRMLSGEDAK